LDDPELFLNLPCIERTQRFALPGEPLFFFAVLTTPATKAVQIFKKMAVTYYTPEGLQKLKDKLQDLRVRGRADIARQIAEARDKGDLSENAEYDAAKDAQGMLEMEISKLEDLVANARVIDASKLDASKVSILSKVKIKNPTGQVLEYTLVAEEEADLKLNKISVKSPIGQGLLGKKVGEVAEIVAPRGKLRFEVLEIAH
jgi:transcription elongation factor GreA